MPAQSHKDIVNTTRQTIHRKNGGHCTDREFNQENIELSDKDAIVLE